MITPQCAIAAPEIACEIFLLTSHIDRILADATKLMQERDALKRLHELLELQQAEVERESKPVKPRNVGDRGKASRNSAFNQLWRD